MEKFKFVLFSIVALGLLGILGYWSVSTIQSGSEYVAQSKIEQLEKENEDLKKEVEKLASTVSALQPKVAESTATPEKTNPEPAVYKYQSLIDELQKLASGNVFLKQKSRGPSVGIVQNFLNIYNNTSSGADNDYGEGTKAKVLAFQKDAGISADGEVGPSTFTKMIEWLKKQ